MRRFVSIALVLGGLVATAASIEAAMSWRRTVNGWERLNLRAVEDEPRRTVLHPALFTAIEVLVTLSACTAASRKPEKT